jgi:hypothetical protein
MVLNNECPQQVQARPVLKVARGANVRADTRNGCAITNVTAVRETAKTLDCRWSPDPRVVHWIPKSQIQSGSEEKRAGDSGEVDRRWVVRQDREADFD